MDISDALDLYSIHPKEAFIGDLQEAINQSWGEQVNLYSVEEETIKGTFVFQEIECNIAHVIDTATGQYKDGTDWRQLSFKEVDHSIERGRYYKFSDNYWLTTFTDEYNQVTKDVVVRRCNNTLIWDGKSYPCVIDYENSSSQPVLNEIVNTPNSTIKVIVQGNDDTLSLDINQKFLLGNSVKKRPYKVINYIDYLQNGTEDTSIPLVYLDLQLIQKSSDDVEEEIPPTEDLRIEVTPEITEILQCRTVTLKSSVMNGDIEMVDSITCTPSNAPESNYELTSNGNEFTLTNLKYSSTPLILTFKNSDESLTKEMKINLRAKF